MEGLTSDKLSPSHINLADVCRGGTRGTRRAVESGARRDR